MKEYKKLLAQYQSSEYEILHHKWGQIPATVYNNLVPVWNNARVGHRIFIQSYKQRGIKRIVSFLREQGLVVKIVGKGPNGLRLVVVEKNNQQLLEAVPLHRPVRFSFLDRSYEVNVGEAAFSAKKLDEGTEFLLKTVLVDEGVSFGKAKVGDVGVGWGPISMVIASENPNAGIVAFESDAATCRAAKENLSPYSNVSVVCADITDLSGTLVKPHVGSLDYIVSNPPFHATAEQRRMLFGAMQKLLNRKGVLYFVYGHGFAGRQLRATIADFFIVEREFPGKGFTVWKCRKP